MTRVAFLSVMLLALLTPVGAAPAPAPPADAAEPAPIGEWELHRVAQSIRALEFIEELRLTPKQAEAAVPWLKKAEAVRQEVQPFEAETIRSLKTLLDRVREALIAGRPFPPVLRREIQIKWRDLEERRMTERSQIELAAWALFNALTPEQVALASEPEWRREMRERADQILDEVRRLPTAAYEDRKREIVTKFHPEEKEQPQGVQQKMVDILEQARALAEADFAARKPALVQEVLALVPVQQKEGAQEPEAERKEFERRSAVKRLTEMLSAPGMLAVLEARAAAK